MQKIDLYSEEAHPYIMTSGDCCETSSVMPFDVSGASSICSDSFDEMISTFKTQQSNFNSHLEDLADIFGSKFISYNGGGLNFVKTDRFNEYYGNMLKAMDNLKTKCVNFCSEINSESETVKIVLTNMQNEYNRLMTAKEELANEKAKPDSQQDASLISDLERTIRELEVILITVDDIGGSWIVEGG